MEEIPPYSWQRLSAAEHNQPAIIPCCCFCNAYFVQYDMGALEQEHLRVVLLDRRNRVLEVVEIYRGSVSSSQVRVGEVFKEAVRKNASGIIVVHNHPSGDPTPSPDDVAVTRAIVQAGKLLDVDVLDHLVIGQGRWVSLKERGLGFG